MSLTPEQLRKRADQRDGMWQPDISAEEMLELADELERLQSAPLVKNGSRLLDLVRYKRHDLHQDGLITDEEFVELVRVGSQSARRLEEYDETKLKLSTYREVLIEAGEALQSTIGMAFSFHDEGSCLSPGDCITHEALSEARKTIARIRALKLEG